jgi:hypothetical protein
VSGGKHADASSRYQVESGRVGAILSIGVVAQQNGFASRCGGPFSPTPRRALATRAHQWRAREGRNCASYAVRIGMHPCLGVGWWAHGCTSRTESPRINVLHESQVYDAAVQ